jgi:excisionase family DNA binding protein
MSEPFVPIEELAKQFTVSVSTVRAWVRQGYIPKDTFLKIGNTYRFNVPEVIKALSSVPKDEPEAPKAVDPKAPVQLEFIFDNPDHDI